MRMTINLILMLLIMCSTQLIAQNSEEAANSKSVAILNKVVKDVEHQKIQTDDWEEAKRGMTLQDGHSIRTGGRSLALVTFLDKSLLRVRENSIVKIFSSIEGTKQNKNTQIDQGVVNFDVSKQQDEEFKFTTPTGLASIRGTSGYFEVIPDKTWLIVEEGLVEVKALSNGGEVQNVGAGNTAEIDKEGNISIRPTTEDEKAKLNNSKKDKTIKYIIETSEGEYELELFDEN